jgi:hypothetical protein
MKEMGFSLVVEELMQAKKPIVGHNMIYDIAYLYNQFINKLPLEYSDFISVVSIIPYNHYLVQLLLPFCVRHKGAVHSRGVLRPY